MLTHLWVLNLLNSMIPDKQKIELVKKEVDEFLYEYQEVKITTSDEYTGAGDLVKQVENKIKKVEEKRKEYTKPLDDLKKTIMADFKQISEPLEKFVNEVRGKMLSWYKEDQIRKDAEQKAIEEKAMEEAKKNKQSEVIVPIVNDIKTQRGDVSTTTVKKIWKWEITDESLVPREYLCVNGPAITQAIRDGVKTIEGLRIYQEESIAIR